MEEIVNDEKKAVAPSVSNELLDFATEFREAYERGKQGTYKETVRCVAQDCFNESEPHRILCASCGAKVIARRKQKEI
jgi:rRNA maturation endonuclease Nob1